jgi:recombination protein RecA
MSTSNIASILVNNMHFFKLASEEYERHLFTSGIIGLPYAIGTPDGIPGGTLLQLLGEPKHGKSTLALDFIAHAQRSAIKDIEIPLTKKTTRMINAVYVDFERSFDPVYAATIGVDLDKLLLLKTDWGEQSFDVVNALLVQGIQIVVIDSIPMFIPMSEEGKSIADSEKIASVAHALGKSVKRWIQLADSANALIILVNQYRAEMSQMTRREKKPFGARIVQYAVKVTIELVRIHNEKERATVQATVTKTKFGQEGRITEFDIVFGDGPDYGKHILTLAIEHDIIKQSGAWYSYVALNNKEYRAQGKRDAVKSFPMEEIKQRIIESLGEE